MILRKLKKYLIEHRKATLKQIANDFGEDPAIIEFMLLHWINKGKIIKKSSNCGLTCKGCLIMEQEYYWMD